jgi:hypothetical protein
MPSARFFRSTRPKNELGYEYSAMNSDEVCNHSTLELLPERKKTLRCRHCHLTIAADDLGDGYCPECFDASGNKRYDFDELETVETGVARYRCEECGAIIKSG